MQLLHLKKIGLDYINVGRQTLSCLLALTLIKREGRKEGRHQIHISIRGFPDSLHPLCLSLSISRSDSEVSLVPLVLPSFSQFLWASIVLDFVIDRWFWRKWRADSSPWCPLTTNILLRRINGLWRRRDLGNWGNLFFFFCNFYLSEMNCHFDLNFFSY